MDDGTGVTDGAIVSHYRLLERLGAGGMGVVYKAEDLRLKRFVALKFLAPERTADEAAKQRFMHEAQAASALDHPNICTVHEIDEAPDGRLFLAMACYDGESLRQRVARGPLAVAEALDLATQVADGLARAHEAGIVHRDIKPANIMVTGRGDAKIVDFGIAKLAGRPDLTQTGTTLGTAAYMAPERFRGADADPCTDVWSLGVTLYEMLTGRLPFEGDAFQIIGRIQQGAPRPIRDLRPDTPEALAGIVGRALEPDRGRRYSSAVELFQDLRACRSALTAPASSPAAPSRSILRTRTGAALLVLAALATASIVGFVLRMRAENRRVVAATQQLGEIERLADAGEFGAALALASSVERVLPGNPTLAQLWPKFTLTPTIRSEPSGARVYRQLIDAPADDWEFLGVTPLEDVRFIRAAGYRLRLEADHYRRVELLYPVYPPSGPMRGTLETPVRLDREGELPAEMVRVPGFTLRDTSYGPYFLDRYEVTNREYEKFVNRGGYRRAEFWTEPFVRDGVTIPWADAVAEFKDQTGRPGPATWHLGTYPEGQADFPVGGVSWYEAAAFARFAGKELPTTHHWWSAQTPRDEGWLVLPRSNFASTGPRAVGQARAMSTYGLYDLAGNVREWCVNEVAGGRATRGGAWTDSSIYSLWVLRKSPFDRDPTNGFRLMRAFDSPDTLALARAPVGAPRPRDYRSERPVADAEFAIFRRLYAYERGPLNAVVEARDQSRYWIREKIAFDLPYGERGGAYLYLPVHTARPLQTVVYWPGSFLVALRSIEDQNLTEFDFLLRSGRAVVLPIFKGSFDRDPKDTISMPATVAAGLSPLAYRDLLVQWVKDVSRTLDYVDTRGDLDASRVAFFGFSWGGFVAPVALAVEPRLKAAVLNVGGLWNATFVPEADAFHFAPRVRAPVLMINGAHDVIFPLETGQRPLFDLLGTPAADKRHYLAEAGHNIPRNELIRETLAWLDRYLGRVD
jgi:eukaryotic-like serine/threonine-protein kinase